jgi:hypothetical protein
MPKLRVSEQDYWKRQAMVLVERAKGRLEEENPELEREVTAEAERRAAEELGVVELHERKRQLEFAMEGAKAELAQVRKAWHQALAGGSAYSSSYYSDRKWRTAVAKHKTDAMKEHPVGSVVQKLTESLEPMKRHVMTCNTNEEAFEVIREASVVLGLDDDIFSEVFKDS